MQLCRRCKQPTRPFADGFGGRRRISSGQPADAFLLAMVRSRSGRVYKMTARVSDTPRRHAALGMRGSPCGGAPVPTGGIRTGAVAPVEELKASQAKFEEAGWASELASRPLRQTAGRAGRNAARRRRRKELVCKRACPWCKSSISAGQGSCRQFS